MTPFSPLHPQIVSTSLSQGQVEPEKNLRVTRQVAQSKARYRGLSRAVCRRKGWSPMWRTETDCLPPHLRSRHEEISSNPTRKCISEPKIIIIKSTLISLVGGAECMGTCPPQEKRSSMAVLCGLPQSFEVENFKEIECPGQTLHEACTGSSDSEVQQQG